MEWYEIVFGGIVGALLSNIYSFLALRAKIKNNEINNLLTAKQLYLNEISADRQFRKDNNIRGDIDYQTEVDIGGGRKFLYPYDHVRILESISKINCQLEQMNFLTSKNGEGWVSKLGRVGTLLCPRRK